MTQVIPAIIPDCFAYIEERVEKVKNYVSLVQVDVVDGLFAPNVTWPYNNVDIPQFRNLIDEEAGLPQWELVDYEIDMMVADPHEKIDDWISAGAKTLIIHIESTDKLDAIIERANERGTDVAVALKPSTSNDVLAPYMDRITFIQCMGNDKISYNGVPFDESVLGKIRDIRERYGDVTIGVDIGVNTDTAPQIVEAGATRVVSGSSIFNSDNIEQAIKEFESLGAA